MKHAVEYELYLCNIHDSRVRMDRQIMFLFWSHPMHLSTQPHRSRTWHREKVNTT